MPPLRQPHPAAGRNVLAALEEGERLPRPAQKALLELLASREGSKRLDLGDGRVAVREYESVWLERGPVPLEGRVRWGRWTLESTRPGLHVRGNGEPVTRIGLTVQQAMGLPVATWGTRSMEVSQPVGAILA